MLYRHLGYRQSGEEPDYCRSFGEDSGDVRFLDHPVEGPDWYRGVVFQTPVLYPWLNVRDNVASGPRMRGLPEKEMERVVDRALELVSLGDFGGHKPYDLSGGMRQRGQGLLKL